MTEDEFYGKVLYVTAFPAHPAVFELWSELSAEPLLRFIAAAKAASAAVYVDPVAELTERFRNMFPELGHFASSFAAYAYDLGARAPAKDSK